MASSCTEGDLHWISGRNHVQSGWSSLGVVCWRKWKRLHPWRFGCGFNFQQKGSLQESWRSMAASTVRPSPTLLCIGKSMRVLGMEKKWKIKIPAEKQIRSLNWKKNNQVLFSCVQKEITIIVVHSAEWFGEHCRWAGLHFSWPVMALLLLHKGWKHLGLSRPDGVVRLSTWWQCCCSEWTYLPKSHKNSVHELKLMRCSLGS